MDNDSSELAQELVPADTPEDVAVLYSWANLQGAKYRDFSAARREYRAQMRLRAAEEQRLAEAQAQAEAEAAAAEAERAAREAEEAARFHETAARRAADAKQRKDLEIEEEARQRALRHAEEMSRIAAAERMEASRRAEAVAAAEAAARREAREMEEARASAERQAAQYRDSETRRRQAPGLEPTLVPGQISDPYSGVMQQVLPGRIFHQPTVPDEDMMPSRHQSREARVIVPQPDPTHHSEPVEREYLAGGTIEQDAEIAARGTEAIEDAASRRNSPVRHVAEFSSAGTPVAADQRHPLRPPSRTHSRQEAMSSVEQAVARPASRVPESEPLGTTDPIARSGRVVAEQMFPSEPRRPRRLSSPEQRPPVPAPPAEPRRPSPEMYSMPYVPAAPARVIVPQPDPSGAKPVSVESSSFHIIPAMTTPVPAAAEMSASQRAYAQAKAEAVARAEAAQAAARRRRGYAPDEASGFFSEYGPARASAVVPPVPAASEPKEQVVPAWITQSSAALKAAAPLEAPRTSDPRRRAPTVEPPARVDTLQNSRERVAARWYALKGIFDHGVQEQAVEKETPRARVAYPPLVSIFSLAGGVGKTSMVASLGRALSHGGERVMLTDTTSHGLLPFYFGASELKPGVVRTFSPPAGSSDAPIYLLSYDVLQKPGDAASADWFSTELARSSAGVSRVILDLSAAAPWVARRLAQMDSTILIPLAPDMNSVISLGAMEKFFAGMKDSSGKQVEPFYVLNQFDSSLALHLDVREVMRQRLDDRLLPFTIRRAPAVPEALAEGMTVIDYSPESAIAEDYRNLASWLKSRSAPAMTAGQKNARWSER